jgi:hypothetical protein
MPCNTDQIKKNNCILFLQVWIQDTRYSLSESVFADILEEEEKSVYLPIFFNKIESMFLPIFL